jgi:hypothetical protein
MLYSNAALRRAVVCPIAAKTPLQLVFWAVGADIGPPLEVPDNAAGNLRRSRDTARAIIAPHQEKSPMLYRGHKI